jgi:hypothetical protein
MRHITYYCLLLAIITFLLVVIKISIDFPFKVFLFELNLWHGNNNEAYSQYCQQDLGILNNNLSTQNEGANLTRYVTSNFNRPGGIGNQVSMGKVKILKVGKNHGLISVEIFLPKQPI